MEKQKGIAKITKAAAEVREWRKWYYERINNAKDYSEFVALSMLGVPDEILRSFGVWSSLAENYGPLCAAKRVSDIFCEAAEEDGFSIDLCSYLKIGIGYLKRSRDLGKIPPEAPYGGMGKIDMVIGPAGFCDGRMQYPLAALRYVNVPFFDYDTQDLPWWKIDKETKKYYIEYAYGRFKELVAFLAKVTDKKYDENRLSEALDLWMKSHKLFNQAAQLRKHHPNPLSSIDSFAVCFPNLHFKGTKECVDFYQRLYDEVKSMTDKGRGAVAEEKYRIYWFGLPPWQYFGAFDYLQSHGFSVIDTTYDAGDVPEDVDVNNPLYAIAKKYYDGVWFGSGLSRRHNFEERIRERCSMYDIDGIITLIGTTCRANTLQIFHRKIINERLNLPVLNLDIDMTDVRSFSEADVKGKLDSFMEAVEVSKKRGR